jgi:hypothetical protein
LGLPDFLIFLIYLIQNKNVILFSSILFTSQPHLRLLSFFLLCLLFWESTVTKLCLCFSHKYVTIVFHQSGNISTIFQFKISLILLFATSARFMFVFSHSLLRNLNFFIVANFHSSLCCILVSFISVFQFTDSIFFFFTSRNSFFVVLLKSQSFFLVSSYSYFYFLRHVY